MSHRIGFLLVFASLVMGALAGCSKSGNVVKGKVTLDGTPVENAQIEFEKGGKEAAGKFHAKTNAEGKFELLPFGANSIQPGTYNVFISKWADPKGKITDPGEIDQLRAAGLAKNVIPEKYGDTTSAVLTAKINEGVTELPAFELVSTKGK